MTGKQSSVMMLGLALIVARLFITKEWSSIWSIIGVKGATTPATPATPAATGAGPAAASPTVPYAPGYTPASKYTQTVPPNVPQGVFAAPPLSTSTSVNQQTSQQQNTAAIDQAGGL